MNAKYLIFAFLGGAVVGVSAAILFAPAKGEETRKKLCSLLKKRGIKISDDEVDALVAELAGHEL